ncbi:type II toxin-antitoxin system HipA family toxin [Corynebacterium camporealensis]
MSKRQIDVVDEQRGTVLGRLLIFDGGRRGPTYQFKAQSPGLCDGPVSPELPPFLLDALPDSWGKKLIKRELGVGREPFAHELLLGVSDEQRTGALRFIENGQALAPSTGRPIPPLVDLGEIDAEIQKVVGDPAQRVSALIGIGSQSLGGARPKATVQDKDGQLWVAKFGTRNDEPKVESRIMNAAQACGIQAAETKHTAVANSDVVLSRRFDRDEQRNRIGMRSYASVLELDDAGRDVDWMDLLEVTDARDHAEMWRRAAFGVLVNNTDDHVRNHSQLRVRDEDGWAWWLSSAYDITHETDPNTDHALSVLGERSGVGIVRVLPELAELAGLSQEEAAWWVHETVGYLREHKIPLHEPAAAEMTRVFSGHV